MIDILGVWYVKWRRYSCSSGGNKRHERIGK